MQLLTSNINHDAGIVGLSHVAPHDACELARVGLLGRGDVQKGVKALGRLRRFGLACLATLFGNHFFSLKKEMDTVWASIKNNAGTGYAIQNPDPAILNIFRTFLVQLIWATCPTSTVTLQKRRKFDPGSTSFRSISRIRCSNWTISNCGSWGIELASRTTKLARNKRSLIF